MKLLVIGASRGIGARVVHQAALRGHQVRAFSRSGGHPAPNVDPVEGDATSPADVAAALEGMDAVFLTLGVPQNLGFIFRKVTLFSQATQVLVPAMQAAGPRRLLAVTGFGAGDSRAALGRLLELPFQGIMGRAYDDKTVQERIIKESGLDWTIARPGFLTDGPSTGRYRVFRDPESWRAGVISRADVAHFLLGAAEAGTHIREAPVLAR